MPQRGRWAPFPGQRMPINRKSAGEPEKHEIEDEQHRTGDHSVEQMRRKFPSYRVIRHITRRSAWIVNQYDYGEAIGTISAKTAIA